MEIILASKSPRRKELLSLLKIPFNIIESNTVEELNDNKSIYEQCIDISYNKALNVYKKTEGDRIIIGSDTIVVFDNKIYGKPKNKIDAFNMIKELSNNYHEVITSITLLVYKDGEYFEEKTYSRTKVFIDKMSDSEINDWVFNNDVCDMAGGYGIQLEFSKYISHIDGDYYTIVGLPINKLYQLIKKYI